MQQKTWLLIFGIITIALGVFVFRKKINKKDESIESLVAGSPVDLINPLSWLIAWIFSKIPAKTFQRIIASLIITVGLYFFYLYLEIA